MTDPRDTTSDVDRQERHAGHGAHGWLMVACCVPMLAIALALVVAGIAGPGFVVAAIGCTAMMALMMRGMDHGGSGHR